MQLPWIKIDLLREHFRSGSEKEEILQGYTDYYEALETFLRDYPFQTWVVFKIITGALAGSPRDETAWFVIDMEAG